MDLNNLTNIAGQIINNPTIEANATIEFQRIVTPAGIERDSMGRYVPTAATSETVSISCYLRQRRLTMSEMQSGIDLDAEPFVGRLVSPKTYDFPIKANGPIAVTINGRTGTMITDDKFFASPTDQQYDIKSNLGQRVSFFVQFRQGQ